MERGLLSDKKLGEFYDQVEWLYLFQDFSGSDADRAAQRVAIRFGISSWPQHFLVNPYTLEPMGSTGRSLKSFAAAVKKAKLPDIVTPDELAKLDEKAAELETLKKGSKGKRLAKEALKHADIVIKMRGLEYLVEHDKKAIAKEASALLATPNDQIRYAVCKILAESGDDDAREALEKLVKETPNSKNPNVLRINAVKALAKCGNIESINVIGPYAASGEYNNGLTGVSIDALVTLAGKKKKGKAAAANHLKGGFPELPKIDKKSQHYERAMRSCTALAKRINTALNGLTGNKVKFPGTYDEESRKKLVEAWG